MFIFHPGNRGIQVELKNRKVDNINQTSLIMLLCVAIFLTPILSFAVDQNQWSNRVNASFTTIQEAINNANFGDMILVPAGIYYEHVFVNKTVLLVGENSNTTIIDGSNSGTIVQITADGVGITGFRLQNSGYGWTRQGVYVYRANNCTIERNSLYNVCHNIRLNYSFNSQVIENRIDGPSDGVTMYGIRIENSVNCSAIGNNVSVRVGAIHLENATECIVRNNYLAKNDQGIRLYSPCTHNLITENTVSDNNYDGMIATMPPDTTFFDNRIFHNNFINDTNPFIIQSTGTKWDDGLEGNYWTRLQNSDLDKNGIADLPYIFGTERDNYPLMGQFTSYDVSNGFSIDVTSDSKIDDFACFPFNNTIRMHVSERKTDQTQGFCRIAIPHSLINQTYQVLIDGVNPDFVNYTLHDDGTSSWIYFNYMLSQHEVIIVPEFHSPLALVVIAWFLMVSVLLVFHRKKTHGTWT
jgi:nitrous oxidase accessory protein